ncbi:MAG: S8 family serine peptidase, partial [candidate division Zixibacteria bacterium]|nr:S8 family serine peptidase [candidate division Zixibacteria bacterium]
MRSRHPGFFQLTSILAVLLICAMALVPERAHAKRFVIKLRLGATLSSKALQIYATPVPGAVLNIGGLQISRSPIAETAIPQKIRQNRKTPAGGFDAVENPLTRIISLSDPGDSLSSEDIRKLFDPDDIEYVEEDHLMELFEFPPDEYFVEQWFLLNNAQSYISVESISGFFNDTLKTDSGVLGEDIGLRENYEAPSEKRKKPLIGIIDTGVDIIHPELLGQIWVNSDEIDGNGIDDDANGLVDDVNGYDFSGDTFSLIVQPHDNDVTDDIGHGSHIAGIIAAKQDGVGVVGVCPNAIILPIKIFPNAFATVSAEAVIYAVNSGVDILSISWGSPFKSRLMQEAFEYAHQAGVFVAVASGNSGDNERFEPADIPSVFTVGAANSRGKVTGFSTYGSHIDIVAPGQDILSIRGGGTDLYASIGEPGIRIIDSIYMIADGTSMAAPMVAGAAGFLLSVRPELRRDELENLLRQGARDIVQPYDTGASFPGPDSISGAGFLDIGRSLALIEAPSIAFSSPPQNSRQTSEFDIAVLQVGNYAGFWSLEYAVGDTSSGFIWLADGVDLPVDGILYAFSSALASGKISFRLTDNLGHQTYLQVIVVGATVARISSPGDGDTLKYLVSIFGYTSGADYEGLHIFYRYENNPEIEIFQSTAEFFDQNIFDWGLGSMPGGAYSLILRAQTSNGSVENSVNVFIESALSPGWPVDAGDFTAISPGASDLDMNGQKEIIVGTRSGLYVYEIDGTVRDGFPVATDRDCRSVPAVYDID